MNELVAYINSARKRVSLLKDSVINIDGKEFHFEIKPLDNSTFLLVIQNKVYEVTLQELEDGKYSIVVNGNLFEVEILTALQEKAKKLLEEKRSVNHEFEVKAPMPGMILKIKKQIGESVNSGEPIIILEAMKMENELRSPITGKIKELFVNEGNPVEKGIKLFSIQSQ
jgi:glutaconyl-CoA/methylmalonyl-CoA decarboxylase subunit gamma